MVSNPLGWKGIGTIVFRTVGDQMSLWEAVLPEELRRLPDELAAVDTLLDDEAFFGPFRQFFDPRIGRPSTPMEVYLRLMFLKFRYRLGYETLCREVADSFTWRRFCRIPFDGAVPHPTTLMKLTTRCGSTAVDGLNRALLARAVEARVVRMNRVRADTTVVPADVAYPTDSGLLAKAVRRIGANVKRIQAAGGAVRTRVRDRSRSAGTRAHGIAARLRSRAQLGRDEARAGVQRITGELAGLAESAITDARRVLVNARRAASRARAEAAELAAAGVPDAAAGRRRGRLVRAVNDLKRLVEATEKIIEQARLRIKGIMPDGATRVVSLHDVQARPIAKGRLGKPAQGRRDVEHGRTFRRHVKWRTGCEGRVSSLKRQYGWDRTRIDSLEGARTWAGQGVFTSNLVKIAALTSPVSRR